MTEPRQFRTISETEDPEQEKSKAIQNAMQNFKTWRGAEGYADSNFLTLDALHERISELA
jgi:hypothetical protein